MELRTIPDITRGCGKMKAGGFYARGDVSANGTLTAWSWVLGEHVVGAFNYLVSVPPRQMQIVHLPATLATGKATNEPVTLGAHPHLRRLPPAALLDHVGSESYTPYSFYTECAQVGPSRRLPETIARSIARHVPIPILFSHSWLPVADPDIVEELVRWAGDDARQRTTTPTPFLPTWGIGRGESHGREHWLIPVLAQMDETRGGRERHLTRVLPPALAENTLIEEQLFGISWITRCIYVAGEDDTNDELEAIYAAGIEPVRVSREEE